MEQQANTSNEVVTKQPPVQPGKRKWEAPRAIETDIRSTASGVHPTPGPDFGFYS